MKENNILELVVDHNMISLLSNRFVKPFVKPSNRQIRHTVKKTVQSVRPSNRQTVRLFDQTVEFVRLVKTVKVVRPIKPSDRQADNLSDCQPVTPSNS
jgi:hypothetical protein